MKLKHVVVIVFVALLLPNLSVANLTIRVEYDQRWGDATTPDIKALCENVALHFQEQLRDTLKINGNLTIVYHSSGPMAFYRNTFGGRPDEYKIGLTVTGRFWAQFAYQFGHEFCHILHNFEETSPNNPNRWFQEALCELANLWVIRRMGQTWATRAPYQNWIGWRHNLTGYAADLMNSHEVQYRDSGAQWLRENEDTFRNGFALEDYATFSQLSYKFLPIFEAHPEAWNAVRKLPTSKSKMSQYMKDWYNAVDPQDREFVADIAAIMSISVETTENIHVDADINNDGYVDLSDVLIVRNAIRNSVSYNTDVNNDGVTDEIDVLIVKQKAMEAIVAAAPSVIRKHKITTWAALKKRK